MFPRQEQVYNIYLDLVDIFNKDSKPAEARLNLARWHNKIKAFGDNGFSKVIETFESHNATIVNYFQDRLTNASAESFNAKIKVFKTQFRGVGDIRFFMYRLATLYS
jgi:transposase